MFALRNTISVECAVFPNNVVNELKNTYIYEQLIKANKTCTSIAEIKLMSNFQPDIK